MDLGSPCYGCRSVITPTKILPPRRNILGPRTKNPHSCLAEDCYNRQGMSLLWWRLITRWQSSQIVTLTKKKRKKITPRPCSSFIILTWESDIRQHDILLHEAFYHADYVKTRLCMVQVHSEYNNIEMTSITNGHQTISIMAKVLSLTFANLITRHDQFTHLNFNVRKVEQQTWQHDSSW